MVLHGVVSRSGAVVAFRLRTAVSEQLELTVSAGVACNKLLAKIGSARNKPNKQTIVLPRAVEDLMRVSVAYWCEIAELLMCLQILGVLIMGKQIQCLLM